MSTPTFNPNLPADHSPLSSAEMRDQLNALQAQIEDLAAQVANCAPRPTALAPMNIPISNPPTQSQVDQIREQLDVLLTTLQG
jgi:hypothetical protein